MKETDLSTFNNSWYRPGNKVKIIIWYFMNATFLTNPFFPFSKPKIWLLKLFGAKIGKGVLIKPRVSVKYPWKLKIGNHVWIGEKVWIDNLGMVTIEDHVCISQGAMLLCGNHNYKKSTFDLIVGDIKLEKGSWVGAHAVVCPKVTIASHSILTVNSVAVKSTEPYFIYQGNPAEKLRERKIGQ
ncbi:MAG: WcaF family extracellular polysaccharide biosynthesis acetyltransferase [Crocinitomicaceae bacterium]|nr:WcaF family extracellular polysaccharide biosynthesis acetyltransferase [Crocinitomicaceae bacterium]